MMSAADTSAGARARAQQVALRIGGMADAHMTPGVEHLMHRQDAVGGDQVVDDRGIDRTG